MKKMLSEESAEGARSLPGEMQRGRFRALSILRPSLYFSAPAAFSSLRLLLRLSLLEVHQLYVEDQFLSGERMIGVERDRILRDFGDRDGYLLPVR